MASLANVDDNARAVALPFTAGQAAQVTFTALIVSVDLAHKLGRKPLGWLVTRVRGGPASPYETASDARILSLTCGVAVDTIVDLWVY
jgi:hypothetical protein